jgi:AcrR family transcriptional regulator
MDETKGKIREAAKRIFLRHGYAETATAAVSARAGLEIEIQLKDRLLAKN